MPPSTQNPLTHILATTTAQPDVSVPTQSVATAQPTTYILVRPWYWIPEPMGLQPLLHYYFTDYPLITPHQTLPNHLRHLTMHIRPYGTRAQPSLTLLGAETYPEDPDPETLMNRLFRNSTLEPHPKSKLTNLIE